MLFREEYAIYNFGFGFTFLIFNEKINVRNFLLYSLAIHLRREKMLQNSIKVLLISLTVTLIIGFSGCTQKKDVKKVSLEKMERLKPRETLYREQSVRIAVGGMITPKEGFAYYKQLLDYIGEKLGRPVELIDKETYAEINDLLKAGEIDVAFVCGGPYVDGHDSFGLELLVAPQAYGESVYYSYIIVPFDSPVKSLEELRGKVFAFTDPLSNTGKLVPTYMLAKMGETPDSFFSEYIYTYKHDKSIERVAQKIVDGAAVDSLVWEYLNRTNPGLTSKTKIIKKSPPYGIPPVVARPGLDPTLKEQIKNILLNAHEDKTGKQILKKMMINKFVVIDDSAYNTIRDMQKWVSK